MTRAFFRAALGLLLAVGMVTGTGFFAPAMAAYDKTPSHSWVPNRPVFAMVEADGVIYLGGKFTNLRNPQTGERVNRDRLAAVDATTGQLIRSWNPGANDNVRSLAVGDNGVVYVGGSFTMAGGRSNVRIAAIDASGNSVPGWSASTNNTVRKIAVDGSAVYIAGNFRTVNGVRRVGIARLAASDGDLVRSFNARVRGGRVRALDLSPNPNHLLLGGSFDSLSGEPREFAGSVDRETGAVTNWNPPPVCGSCQLLDITSEYGIVYGAVGGGGGGRAAAWSLSSGELLWIRHGDGNVQAVDVHDGVAYFGGHFGPSFLKQERHQLVALDAVSGDLLSFQLDFTGSDAPGIWAVIADAGELRIAGGFRLANAPQNRYASFPAS